MKIISLLLLALLAGCSDAAEDRQELVEQFHTAEVYDLQSFTGYVVRDTNGAIWVVSTVNHVHATNSPRTKLFDAQK